VQRTLAGLRGYAMERYEPAQIRNVALLGHSKAGKTTLAEAMLFATGVLSRMGRVEDGNTVSDYDRQEHDHGYSISTSLIALEFNAHQINLLDTPGYTDFEGEVVSAAAAAEAAVIAVDAVSGIEGGTEAAWEHVAAQQVPARIFVVSRLDREHADYGRVVQQLRDRFGTHVVPLAIPVFEGGTPRGVAGLLGGDATGADAEAFAAARESLVEAVAESDDELLEHYLDGQDIDEAELTAALRGAVSTGAVVPVLPLCASEGLGVSDLMEAIVSLCPSPIGREHRLEGDRTLTTDGSGPLVAHVFKTASDPFVGHLSFVKVLSGQITHGDHLRNHRSNQEERAPHVFTMRGKEQIEIDALVAGDIGAIPKLNHTATGDTLVAPGAEALAAPSLPFPTPTYRSALHPQSRDDVDRMSQALHKLMEQDRTITLERDADTGETILATLGDVQAGIVVSRLAREFNVTVEATEPRVPYRETIRAAVQAEYRHKKQSGGRGQYGHVVIKVEPLDRGGGFEFAEQVVGGSVPRQFIPAVQHGVEEALAHGPLAKSRLVDLRVTLLDGSSHSVDSSELAFKLAASQALHQAVLDGSPVLLEPIMRLRVEVPSDRMGDLTGEISGRRGHVLGVESAGPVTVVEALAPLAEVQRFTPQVRAISHGRGKLHLAFDHYAEVPQNVQEQVLSSLVTTAG
jgi:elongation factor G